MSWEDDALCLQTDLDAFHPEIGDNAAVKRAKSICAVCPVQKECLTHALEKPENYGIWGGLTPRERGILRRTPV